MQDFPFVKYFIITSSTTSESKVVWVQILPQLRRDEALCAGIWLLMKFMVM